MIDPSLWFVSVQSTGHLNTFETHCQNTSLKDSTDWQGFQMFALQTPGTAGEGGSEQKKLGVRVVSHTNKKMHPLGQWHLRKNGRTLLQLKVQMGGGAVNYG